MNLQVHSPRFHLLMKLAWLKCAPRALPHHQNMALPPGIKCELSTENICHVDTRVTRTQQTPTAPPSPLLALLTLLLGQSIVLIGNSSCRPFLSTLWLKLPCCPSLARAISIAYTTPHMAPEASSYVCLNNSTAILQIPSL